MSKYSLAVVCVLALIAGGATRLLLHYAGSGAPEVHGVSEKSLVPAAQAVTAAGPIANQADNSSSTEGNNLRNAGGYAATHRDDVQAEVDSADRGAKERVDYLTDADGKATASVRGRTATNRRARRVSGASDGYARVSVNRANGGGRSIAGHTFNGVKKTGGAISKAFGKVGGIFHD